jgi:apolipoprotein N-acyltransferase
MVSLTISKESKAIKLAKKNEMMLAVILGALASFSFAPYNIFLLFSLSISGLFLILERNRKDTALDNVLSHSKITFLYGFGFFLGNIYWISVPLFNNLFQFGWLVPLSLTVAPSLYSIFFLIFGALYGLLKSIANKKYSKNYSNPQLKLILVIFFIFSAIFSEFLRSNIAQGFPWTLFGYIALPSIEISQIASLGGIYLLSLLVLIFSILPIMIIKAKNSKTKITLSLDNSLISKIFLGFVVVIFFTSYYFGKKNIEKFEKRLSLNKENSSNFVKLRLIQGNSNNKNNSNNDTENFTRHIEYSQNSQDFDAVIWPETAMPYLFLKNDKNFNNFFLPRLQSIIPREGVLIFGAVTGEVNKNKDLTKIWNSVVQLDKNLEIKIYDKKHLVPFGEFVPFKSYLPFVNKITRGSIDFSSGKSENIIKNSNFTFRPAICYESIFFYDILRSKKEYSMTDLIVILTNDSWFGNTSAPYQHLSMARLRAIEHNKPIARVANSGITAHIDSVGRIVEKTNLNTLAILDVKILKTPDITVYQRYQNIVLPIILTALLMIALVLLYFDLLTSASSRIRKFFGINKL